MATKQTTTTDFTPIGGKTPTGGLQNVGFWIDSRILAGVGVKFKLVAYLDKGDAQGFDIPLKQLAGSDVEISIGQARLSADADQRIVLTAQLEGLVPFVELQVASDTAGSDVTILNISKSGNI